MLTDFLISCYGQSVNIRKGFQHSVRTIELGPSISLFVFVCVFVVVKTDRCKELHGCGKKRESFEDFLQLSDHILPQINDCKNQLSMSIIVFQVVGWAVVVAALITSINKSPVDESPESTNILGYDQNGAPCYTCFITHQGGGGECCD